MKKIKKCFSVIIACLLLFSITGCGKIKGEKGVLSIASFEGGYGNTWTQALADAYKKYNPNIKVKVACNALVRDDAVTALQTNISDVDLYFIDGLSTGDYCENYDSISDISELYNSKPKVGDKEESLTVKEKIMPEIVSEMTYGGDKAEFVGKYYTAPSPSGPCSLILNIDALDNVFGKGNWTEPKTTDELMTLCDAIKAEQAKVTVAGVKYTVYPFIYGGTAVEYWRYLYYPWIAQYGGISDWNDLQSVKQNGEYSEAAYQPEGKIKAYQKLEKIIKRANGYCDSTSMNNQFNTSQKYFFQGRACMFVTGDWLEREMESATEYKANLKMVKTPIISDLAEKLESKYTQSLGASAKEKDAKLSEIVSAVDNGKSSVEGVKKEVFDAVKEARAITFSLGNNAVGFVPKVSVNKEIAIDFLRFMYSDEGVKIILKESKSYIPVINTSEIKAEGEVSLFRQSVNTISQGDIKYIFTSSRDPIHYRAGLDCYVGNEKPEVAMGKKTGALTASEYLIKEANLLHQKWSEFMKVL